MYFVDLLTGARDEGAGRTMAEAFVRRALEFRRMTRIGFLGRYAGEISRAARCFPGVKADEVAQRAFALHQRLGEAVHSVLVNGVRAYAGELIDQTLPASSVLRMAVVDHRASFVETPIKDPAEVSGLLLAEALSIEEPTLRRRVNRFRQAVCPQFEENCGLPLPKDAIIETKEWSGYWLNPSVRLVDPGQVAVAERASRLFTTKSHLRLNNDAESRS